MFPPFCLSIYTITDMLHNVKYKNKKKIILCQANLCKSCAKKGCLSRTQTIPANFVPKISLAPKQSWHKNCKYPLKKRPPQKKITVNCLRYAYTPIFSYP